jgi:hypothetical protein
VEMHHAVPTLAGFHMNDYLVHEHTDIISEAILWISEAILWISEATPWVSEATLWVSEAILRTNRILHLSHVQLRLALFV